MARAALCDLTKLRELILFGNAITDISALANLINLESLDLGSNSISDISVLSNLTNLTYLNLSDNTISDLSPLVANTGIGGGDRVFVANNPLSAESLTTHLPALYSRFDKSAYRGPCVPILPKNLSVDAGSSHTLQTTYYLHVDHRKIRPPPPTAAIAYVDFNEDGHMDIFYAPGIGTRPFPLAAELYLNNGAGNFYPDTNFFGGNPPHSPFDILLENDGMDGEMIPYGKKFSECISRATKKESACAILHRRFFFYPSKRQGIARKTHNPLFIGRGGGI